jgi:Plasmid pRiA4b ORF-3-like protein
MIDRIARLRIELPHLAPCSWRSVEVSLTTNLRAQQEIIQAAMPWEGTHLYQFTVGDRAYAEPDPENSVLGREVYEAKGMRLGRLIDRGITEFL